MSAPRRPARRSDTDAPLATAWMGDTALRVELPGAFEPREVWDALRTTPAVFDVVVAERHACVYLDAPARDPAEIESAVARALAPLVAPRRTHRRPFARALVTVRARYDGPDLARVAELARLTVDEVIALHTAPTYTVRYLGFLPGFAYLGEVDPRIAVARLPAPRARVPAGAIGLAGARTGIYPFASPGGWNLIATAVDFVAFDPQHGARLQLSDAVRFERV